MKEPIIYKVAKYGSTEMTDCVSYVDYALVKSSVEGLASNALRLGNEVRDLSKEIERLKGEVNYWKIESDCNYGRWTRTLEDLEHIRLQK